MLPTFSDGYVLPANTTVVMLIEAMHHDPTLWPDPYKFDPDRFDRNLNTPFMYIPFSAGTRNCLGDKIFINTTISSRKAFAVIRIFSKKYFIYDHKNTNILGLCVFYMCDTFISHAGWKPKGYRPYSRFYDGCSVCWVIPGVIEICLLGHMQLYLGRWLVRIGL